MCAFPTSPEPFRIEPIFSPRLWGSRSLAPLFPEKSNLAEPIGEAWLTGLDCKIATGPFAGKTLAQVWPQMGPEWRGSDLAGETEFPLLLKFIFPKDKLSIQVHPDDAYAAAHEQATGGRGKTEMWHIVSAEPGARLLAGLKPGTTKEKFHAAMADGSLENLFQSHDVHAGDTFFIPAGTPHTIGPNMVVCEVQEYSDLTYRVYDYGRVDAKGKPRELHVSKALEVTRFNDAEGGKIPSAMIPGPTSRHLLTACRYFAAERWDSTTPFHLEPQERSFALLVIASGTGKFKCSGHSVEYRAGECWFVPPRTGDFSVQPEQKTALIRAYVPELTALRSELRRQGLSASSISQAVFD